MEKIKELKRLHFEMFEAKREEHKNKVAELYRKFTENVDFSTVSKAVVFSEFYNYLADNFSFEIYSGELIVGTCWHWRWGELISDRPKPHNMGHFIADFEGFLKLGIKGKKAVISSSENSKYKNAMLSALEAFSKYIDNYSKAAYRAAELSDDNEEVSCLTKIAEDCAFISENPPQSFAQSLQLVWFIQCFAETEGNDAAISFGRADKYLYGYYKNDIESGALTEESALELIMSFYIKTSEGDESQMLTVGGDTENRLSTLFLRAQKTVDMRQPSIAVIVSENTSDGLLREAAELALNGGGMPAYFNDGIIKRGLLNIGIKSEDIEDYAIVGCYEAAPQGSFSNTVAYGFNLYDSFSEFTDDPNEYNDFEELLDAYKAFYTDYYKNRLVKAFENRLADIKNSESPFAACILKGCDNSDLLPEAGGCEYFLFGLNILGLGVLTESLNVIRELVFNKKLITLKQLKKCADLNFADEKIYSEIKRIKSFYGSNSPETNKLVNEISDFIYKVIHENPIDESVIVSPGLFWFTADIWQRDCNATLNGRKKGELLSYGIMPCAALHKTDVLSTLLSSANTACDKFPNGCPAMITLNKSEIAKTEIISSVLKTYFKSGGFHLAINTVDSEILRKARQRPEEYTDILVKLSGYSALFVGLDEKIQDAVIERAEG